MKTMIAAMVLAGGVVTTAAQDAVQARMAEWATALGVDCTHCHVPDRWTDTAKPAFEFAQRMSRMVAALNEGALQGLGGVTCWTCHRGQPIPGRLPRERWEKLRADHAGEFAGRPNRAIAMSVYAASLGVDCSHCHEADRTLMTRPPKAVVAKMLPIFEEIPKYFDRARMPNTQCYMCHQGKIKPERAPGH